MRPTRKNAKLEKIVRGYNTEGVESDFAKVNGENANLQAEVEAAQQPS